MEKVALPNGACFRFWDDQTHYKKVYHVAGEHPRASDANAGSETRPFRTIGRAAQILQPGEKVLIHQGIYREKVQPARGGEGPDRMIAYEAAPGEKPVLRGSRVWTPKLMANDEWDTPAPANGATVWVADLPTDEFGAYNPFLARNMCDHFNAFPKWTPAECERFMMRRGMIFADGKPLKQVFWPRELGVTDGAFWVEEPGTRVLLRLPGDADPSGATLEVTAQEQVFAPARRHLGYVRVKGLCVEHSADPIPVPQRAALSTSRGHHWIIEDCIVRHAHAVGIDIGVQDWRTTAKVKQNPGCHIVRRNVVSDCGLCGMAGCMGVNGTLIEDNLIERIGSLQLEHTAEGAGLKLHTCDSVLIRRNVFRHISDAVGLWLDYLISNTRVTQNVLADIENIDAGAIYVEVSHAPNLVDGNIVWGVRGKAVPGSPVRTNPPGIHMCTGEYGLVAHNLVMEAPDGAAIQAGLAQKDRLVDGRAGLCRRHCFFNNLVAGCKVRVHLGRSDENACDGNVYGDAGDDASFEIQHPEPAAKLNLKGWQEFFYHDTHGRQIKLQANFDPQKLALQIKLAEPLPVPVKVPVLTDEGRYPLAGPFTQKQWDALAAGRTLRLPLVRGRAW